MKVIKLDAIDSTNEFLKGLANKQEVDNYTIVTAKNQTKGKGQMGSVWNTESGKNLIMSILVKDFLSDINRLFDLNIAVAVAVHSVLKEMDIPELSIKWPNDIMSYNKKIGGILIENSIKSDATFSSIVGLGLNVNQTNFEMLPKASSLAVVTNCNFEVNDLAVKIGEAILKITSDMSSNAAFFWNQYDGFLFKKGVPMAFEAPLKGRFMGIITGVSLIGKLQIMLEDDSTEEFDIKEVQMLY